MRQGRRFEVCRPHHPAGKQEGRGTGNEVVGDGRADGCHEPRMRPKTRTGNELLRVDRADSMYMMQKARHPEREIQHQGKERNWRKGLDGLSTLFIYGQQRRRGGREQEERSGGRRHKSSKHKH